MSASAEDKRAELKKKLAEKTNKSHKTRKDTKEQAKAKEDADKEAKVKEAADKEAKVKKAKVKAEAEAAAKRAAAAAAPAAGPWADENDEASQIGIHLGISCDGCGHTPPLIGKAMKCKDCPDFDLCDKCYPERYDKAREEVCIKAGMPGKGRHPAGHKFAPRKAGVVMTPEAVAKELAAAAADAAAKAEPGVPAAPLTEAERKASEEKLRQHLASLSGAGVPSVGKAKADIWRPSAKMIAELPTPQGHPKSLGALL